jgi:hypothetical protein
MSDFPMFLAKQLGVSRRTVTRWCEARKVPGAYRTKGGHWRGRRPRGRRITKTDKITALVLPHVFLYVEARAKKKMLYRSPPPHSQPPKTMEPITERLNWLRWRLATLEWRLVAKMEELTASPEFDHAVEYSIVAKEISHDDMRDPMDLKDRDPEKFRALIGDRDPETKHVRPTPMREFISERAYDAIRKRDGMLMVKAKNLGLNMTSASLARELKISVATLYRRYGRAAVKRARVFAYASVRDEAPEAVRYQVNG